MMVNGPTHAPGYLGLNSALKLKLTAKGRGEKLRFGGLMTPQKSSRLAASFSMGALFILLTTFASGQRGDIYNSMGSTTDTTRSYASRTGGTIVEILVYAANGKTLLDRQAVVKATNQALHTVNWQVTDDRSEVGFELI